MSVALIVLAAIVVVLLVILFATVKVAREYERGVIFRLGRLLPQPKGPGLFLLIPVIDRMEKVDLRTVTLNVPPQEVITKDNVPVRVNAVAYFRIVEPKAAIVQVENYMVATSQIAQTTLRSVLGQHVLDELLSERDKINQILQSIIDEATSPWGIKVSIVEVKDVEIPTDMQRAMARQAEAERERRAKVISAEGEFQASERLKDAAAVRTSRSPSSSATSRRCWRSARRTTRRSCSRSRSSSWRRSGADRSPRSEHGPCASSASSSSRSCSPCSRRRPFAGSGVPPGPMTWRTPGGASPGPSSRA